MSKQRSTLSKGRNFNAKLVRHCCRFWQQSRTLLRHCCWCGTGFTEYTCTMFCIDDSSHFPFRARTNRQTDATERYTHAGGYAGVGNDMWEITAFIYTVDQPIDPRTVQSYIVHNNFIAFHMRHWCLQLGLCDTAWRHHASILTCLLLTTWVSK